MWNFLRRCLGPVHCIFSDCIKLFSLASVEYCNGIASSVFIAVCLLYYKWIRAIKEVADRIIVADIAFANVMVLENWYCAKEGPVGLCLRMQIGGWCMWVSSPLSYKSWEHIFMATEGGNCSVVTWNYQLLTARISSTDFFILNLSAVVLDPVLVACLSLSQKEWRKKMKKMKLIWRKISNLAFDKHKWSTCMSCW